jgi:hypothetical protein
MPYYDYSSAFKYVTVYLKLTGGEKGSSQFSFWIACQYILIISQTFTYSLLHLTCRYQTLMNIYQRCTGRKIT